MDPFWHFTRKMLRYRATVAWTIVFAIVSATGLGVGLVALGPILRVILSGQALPDLARQFNAAGHWLTIPQPLIARLPADPLMGIVLLMAFIVALTFLGGLANFLHRYLSQALAAATVARIRQEAFAHVTHLPLGKVIRRGPSEFIARIIRDSAELQAGFVALMSKSLTQVAKGVAALAAAFWFEWKLSLGAVVLAPALAVVLRKLGKRIRRGTRGSLQAQEGLLRVATEAMHGLRAVKANTGERLVGSWFHRINKVVLQQELRVRTARSLTGPLIEVIATIIVCGLAVVACHAILTRNLDFDSFMLALTSMGISMAAFRPLTGLINEIQAASAPAGRLAEVFAEPREDGGGARPRQLPRHELTIEFEDVCYTYPGADRPAVQNVSLRIRAGQRVAFVGPNGSGKTTLLSMLPRLFDPDTGRVLIDGRDVATVSLRSLRRQIGAVTQETVMFRGTVADNIAFGHDAGEGDRRAAIIAAARRAHADEFVQRLPRGYDTDLSEQGASLSGGQRQRLAIARAILRDPAILILDEATSQIDAESEAFINAALADFCRGRTALIIAHRLSTVHTADRIVVMDGGRIVADGRHEQLRQTCDLYQRLTQTQLVGSPS